MRYSILSSLVFGTACVLATESYTPSSYPTETYTTVTASYTKAPTYHPTPSYAPPPTYHTDCGDHCDDDCGDHCGGTCGDEIVQAPYEECDLGPALNVSCPVEIVFLATSIY